MKTTLFISDLHLSDHTPKLNQMFQEFMHTQALSAERVYILGDLFDFWIGDDESSSCIEMVRGEIKNLTAQGVECFFLAGNRDFLLGKKFAKSCGLKLLKDYAVIDLYGEKTLLCHGDTLCTDDVRYQNYRVKVHQSWRQWLFLHLPLWVRLKIAHNIRQKSQLDKQHKQAYEMDVNHKFVEQIASQYGVSQMIHGHIHHQQLVETANLCRYVLGDWGKTWSILQISAYGKKKFIN